MKSKPFVLVTTDSSRRGVFAGELAKRADDVVVLKNARMAVHWSSDVHGVLGLAAGGPTSSCRISPAVPLVTLNGVTSIADCTAQARKAWEAEPWG